MRSSPLWKLMIATVPPGFRVSGAIARSRSRLGSSRLTSIRMAWKVRAAGCSFAPAARCTVKSLDPQFPEDLRQPGEIAMVQREVAADDLEAVLRFLQVQRVEVETHDADAELQQSGGMAAQAEGAVDDDLLLLRLERLEHFP